MLKREAETEDAEMQIEVSDHTYAIDLISEICPIHLFLLRRTDGHVLFASHREVRSYSNSHGRSRPR